MSMSLAEAIPWVYPGRYNRPEFNRSLQELYPDLPTDRARMQAWVKVHESSIRAATSVFLAAHANDLYVIPPPASLSAPNPHSLYSPSGITTDDLGSLFARCVPEQFHVPIYWNPPMIQYQHEEFVYDVSTPEHVAALHAIRDWPTALAYLLTHYDTRRPLDPVVCTVTDGWDPVAEGAPMPTEAFSQGKPKIRYTLVDWRKQRAAYVIWEIPAVQRYYEEHYDLKEVLDAEGNLVSCERAADYVPSLVRQ
ncbi:hypothetical protein C8J57DRAFT_1532065 [Mycena rebaudengoi]|nr:hypothetical protein C8J57DRAFT_1532065 [Mycena rebaudengoi]